MSLEHDCVIWQHIPVLLHFTSATIRIQIESKLLKESSLEFHLYKMGDSSFSVWSSDMAYDLLHLIDSDILVGVTVIDTYHQVMSRDLETTASIPLKSLVTYKLTLTW